MSTKIQGSCIQEAKWIEDKVLLQLMCKYGGCASKYQEKEEDKVSTLAIDNDFYCVKNKNYF